MKVETGKDVIKIIRTVIELAVVVFLVYLTARALLVYREYVPYDDKNTEVVDGEDHGFLALSYIGVAREGTETLISTKQLEEQLRTLADLGYVTITQQDILDYYENGKPLPKKAMFLMFEDGRNDTSVFAQPIMEECNYKATVFSYAEKFIENDPTFSMADDLKSMEKTGFWELGSNGYRLQYINVFDRNGRFLGELTSKEYSLIMPYLGKDYNQYLMDFLRDKNKLPVETPDMMKRRVEGEYGLMKEMYMQELGKVPRAYVLMHSNTGGYATNDKVSKVNEDSMSKIFDMNFNREGYSMNYSDSSIYDLTRMQPDAWWSTNHLLMRIKWDLPEEDREFIEFVDGDKADRDHFETVCGALECRPDEEKIVVTSEPETYGVAKVKGEPVSDVTVEATLKGNKLGTQTVYLRADDALNGYVAVVLENNMIYVNESGGEPIFTLDLRDFDGVKKISKDEYRRDSMADEYAALARYSGSYRESQEYKKLESETRLRSAASVEEGAEEYIPPLQASDSGSRKLRIVLNGNSLWLYVDDRLAAEELHIERTEKGSVMFGVLGPDLDGDENRIPDDIYDGIFERVKISVPGTDPTAAETVLYSNCATGTKKVMFTVKKAFDRTVNWFITNL